MALQSNEDSDFAYDVELQSREVLCKTTGLSVRAGREVRKAPAWPNPRNQFARKTDRIARLAGSKVRNATRDENEDDLVPQFQDKMRLPFKCCMLVPWFKLKLVQVADFTLEL